MEFRSFDCKREYNELTSWLNDFTYVDMQEDITDDIHFYLREYPKANIALREHESMISLEVVWDDVLIDTKYYNYSDYAN